MQRKICCTFNTKLKTMFRFGDVSMHIHLFVKKLNSSVVPQYLLPTGNTICEGQKTQTQKTFSMKADGGGDN